MDMKEVLLKDDQTSLQKKKIGLRKLARGNKSGTKLA
jgi:hypothetical protein